MSIYAFVSPSAPALPSPRVWGLFRGQVHGLYRRCGPDDVRRPRAFRLLCALDAVARLREHYPTTAARLWKTACEWSADLAGQWN